MTYTITTRRYLVVQPGLPDKPGITPAVIGFCGTFALGVLLLGLSAGVLAWEYTLGQVRHQQQANFCDNESDAREIARLFKDFSPQTGYSALSSAAACATKIATFTPVRILVAIGIATGEPIQYTLSFVEVHLDEGTTAYMITTRAVRE